MADSGRVQRSMYRNSVPDRIQQSPHTFPDVRERASRRKPDVFWSGERRGVSPTCLRTVGNSRYAEDLVDDPNCSKTRRAYASTLASRMTRLLGVPNQTHHTLHFTSKQAQQTNTNEPRRLDTPLFLKHMRRLPQSGGHMQDVQHLDRSRLSFQPFQTVPQPLSRRPSSSPSQPNTAFTGSSSEPSFARLKRPHTCLPTEIGRAGNSSPRFRPTRTPSRPERSRGIDGDASGWMVRSSNARPHGT